jgi:hypothetical protein
MLVGRTHPRCATGFLRAGAFLSAPALAPGLLWGVGTVHIRNGISSGGVDDYISAVARPIPQAALPGSGGRKTHCWRSLPPSACGSRG